ncbi:GDSL family lipase [Wenjunlia vitaminophila]|uniref:GDSL family lipase n=1 Tax=Wenjunlia vitaminophila TaxID=76728 RepID=A0A0T6LS52_WENVI|nr:SGNH/GDSL hydrolase family protein [Wenjunlia vitaminophila]KRV48761.1 GDSL family lipase [Wenjunlia vitaminophila]
MSRARVARRIATAAAVGSGGLGLMGGLAFGVLFTEAKLARRSVGGSDDVPPQADGRYGTAFADPLKTPIVLAFLGDSTAAGQGVRHAGETPGALLASGLAAVAERPVDLVNVALSGARSDDLGRQVDVLQERGTAPDVAMIMIGANDVTSRMAPAESVRHLADAVRRLRESGVEVVVGTCPDLGSVEPVYQPLRWVARRLSRQLAAAQTIAVVEQGGRTVSLGTLLGPEFEADPKTMFGPDHYHPSAQGYATAAMALLPSLSAALGLWPEERLDEQRGEGVLPVARAAVEAVDQGGTEVAAADPGARGDEPGGRWALLKRRRRRRLPADEPVPSGTVGPGGVATSP